MLLLLLLLLLLLPPLLLLLLLLLLLRLLHKRLLVQPPQVTNEGFVKLLECAGPRLHDLNLHGCERLSDAAFHAIAAHCPSLRSLRCGYTTGRREWDTAQCPQVTDGGLAAVAQQCSHLRVLELDLHFYNLLTDAGVAALLAGPWAPALQGLMLWNCASLSAPTLQLIIRHYAPRIAEVSLLDCYHTYDGYLLLVPAMWGLRTRQVPAPRAPVQTYAFWGGGNVRYICR